MYIAVLILHSLLRWSALIAGVGATFMALINQGDNPRLERWGLALMIALDLQMLVGLTLYFGLSPFTRQAMSDFGAAMANPGLRFFAVEHAVMMIAAVVLAHLGRILPRKASTARAKRTRMIVCFGLSTLLMVMGTPWPGTANGRPLFRVS